MLKKEYRKLLETDERHLEVDTYGSSEIADIVMGNGDKAYARKVYGDGHEHNSLSIRGTLLEEPIMLMKALEEDLDYIPAASSRWEHKGVKFRSTPDFWAWPEGAPEKRILIDVKCHHWTMKENYGPENSGAVPDHVWIQAQAHCHGAEISHVWILAEIGSESAGWWVVERDEEAFEKIMDVVVEFHSNHVVKRIPPPAEATPLSLDNWKRVPVEEKAGACSKALGKRMRAYINRNDRAKKVKKSQDATKAAVLETMAKQNVNRIICPTSGTVGVRTTREKPGKTSLRIRNIKKDEGI